MDAKAAGADSYYSSLLALAVDKRSDEFFSALHAALAERMPVDFIEIVESDSEGGRRSLYRHAPPNCEFLIDEALIAASMKQGVAQAWPPERRTVAHLGIVSRTALSV